MAGRVSLLVPDRSAIVAYTAGPVHAGAPIADVHSEGRIVVPSVGMIEGPARSATAAAPSACSMPPVAVDQLTDRRPGASTVTSACD